jgi:hypothetical protein
VNSSIRKSAAILLAPAMLAGCYSYSTIEPAAVTPGMNVRARVSSTTAERIGPSLGMSDARLLSGEVVESQPGALTLKVPSVPVGTPGAAEGLYQQIVINRQDVLEVESRKLDVTRTRIVIGGVVVAAGAIFATATLHGRATGDGPTTEGPSTFNIGIFRLHF